MLALAVIKVAIEHLNSTISGEIKLHRKMRNDLENMKMTLESVDVVLRDAERESIKHKSMLLWLKQLKDAAIDISHMLEDFEDETDLNLMFQLPKDGCCSGTRLTIQL
uniref:Disease resistance N-terminal domain-containing protein n=1 Tax=Triticum urartu TaxID=4572 RepID=A0A8R7RDV9_TRIUA